jgi:mannose-6-phosphate isomerase
MIGNGQMLTVIHAKLHNDIAIDAFDFSMKDDFRVDYYKGKNTRNEMVSCPFFTTNFIEITQEIPISNKQDSFIIYMCVDGYVDLSTDNSIDTISKGETILIPAQIKDYKLSSAYGSY